MKKTNYIVHFAHGSALEVGAFNPFEAAILCAAEKINKGENYEVVQVYNIETETPFRRTLDFKLLTT